MSQLNSPNVIKPHITLAVDPTIVTEDGTDNLVYTFTRTGDTTNALTVKYSITGTADCSDYTGATPGICKTITFAAGASTATLTIDPTADTIVESNETVALTLAAGTDYTIGTTTAVTGIIRNDHPVISFSCPTFRVNENGEYISAVTIIRTGNVDGVDSVTVTPTNGTARSPGDFNSNPIIVNFANGETSKTIRIPIKNDTAVESTETVNLTLSNPSRGATLGSQQTAVLTIVDNDGSFGYSITDPNLKTLDGIYYGFQSVGVFTLLKSTTEDFEIQARQESWNGNSNVSVNKAIAIKIGGNRFQLDLSANPLKIDGIATNLPNGQYQQKGTNNIVRYNNTYIIISENGDQIQVVLNGSSHINVLAYPASNRKGNLVGLLGNYNGNPNDDFALRNGTVIGGTVDYNRIYGDYGNSWSVTGADSLFIEPNTTAPTFPTTVITINTLTPQERAEAETSARDAGITDPTLLNAAILDIHVTNRDNTFIQDHKNLQQLLNINRIGKAIGDPHLNTLDGVKYDFQAAGEFTLVKSTTDDFEVQTRQEHWRGKTNVSVNTAVALKLGGEQIEFYLNAPDSTIINGNSTTIANNLSYVIGQNLIAHNGNKYTVISDNGDQIDISFQSDYINVSVALADNRKGNVVGLLGNYNGNVSDEFALRNGTLIGGSISNQRLYTDYGRSWSVTQPNSLFDYAPGQNTNISFSYNALTFDTLDPQVRASAEQIVRNAGITDPDILQNAIVDFVLTNGSPEFFQGHVNQQRELAPPGSSFTLVGDDANDILGGIGVDNLSGGKGKDTYFIDNTADTITENTDEGTDRVFSIIDYTLGDNLENLTLTGTTAINGTGNNLNNSITGNTGNNVLTGNLGNDILNGGAGADTMIGGEGADTMIGGVGNDSYNVDNTADAITENLNEGTDNVSSTINYTLGDNLENLTLTGTTAINGTGNKLNNSITGNTGNNVLTGGLGNDTLNGGLGNDTLNGGLGNDTMIGGVDNDSYYVDNAADTITENLNEGTDNVFSTINYTLGDNLENLTLTGTTAINGTGNELNNSITGNAAANVLTGGLGNDTLNGGAGADTMIGGVGTDRLYLGLNDNAVDNVNYVLGDGTDTVYQFVRGVGGDQLNFSGIANFDVITSGTSTLVRVGDGIGGNAGFGTGQLLVTLSGTSGFTSANFGDNLFGGTFLFS